MSYLPTFLVLFPPSKLKFSLSLSTPPLSLKRHFYNILTDECFWFSREIHIVAQICLDKVFIPSSFSCFNFCGAWRTSTTNTFFTGTWNLRTYSSVTWESSNWLILVSCPTSLFLGCEQCCFCIRMFKALTRSGLWKVEAPRAWCFVMILNYHRGSVKQETGRKW